MTKMFARFVGFLKKILGRGVCNHDWQPVKVTDYFRYKDNHAHYEAQCSKCGAICNHPDLADAGAWESFDGVKRRMIVCQCCGQHDVVPVGGTARFLCRK